MGHAYHVLKAYSCLTACNDQLSAGQKGALAGLPTFTSSLVAGVDMHALLHPL